MDDIIFIVGNLFVGLLCLIPFVIYVFIMSSINLRIQNWYFGKVKKLSGKDQSIFTVRNMASAFIILLLFFSPIVLNAIFHWSFFDPSWNCYLFIGAIVGIILFQGFQFIWLNYRTRKKT